MWGIASINFGSTYTKNDYLGKNVLNPVPRDVGCVCVVRCSWVLLSLAALVPLVWAGGTPAVGLANPVGRSWADIPEQLGVLVVYRNGRPVEVGHPGLWGVLLFECLDLG